MMRTIVLLGLVVAATSAAAQVPPTCDVEVRLREAVWRAAAPDRKGAVTLNLQRAGGRWDPFAVVLGFNAAGHDGWVLESSTDGQAEVVRVLVQFRPDLWEKEPAWAEYVLRLGAKGPECEGTWSGTVRGEPAQGTLSGMVHAVRAVEGFKRPAPGEHPRLLVRRADLPGLRAKARTDWGKPWLERLAKDTNNPVAQAMAYALTGEAGHAANARRRMEKALDGHEWYHIGIAHAPAFIALEHLIAYDLIHDACDEAFRRRMEGFLRDKMDLYYWGAMNSQFNPNATSNWSLMYRSGGGLVGLALLDSPWEAPVAQGDSPRRAAASRPHLARPPARDAPAVLGPLAADAKGDAVIGAWTFAGPVEQGFGEAAAPPPADFQPVPAEMIQDGALDLAALTKRQWCRAVYLRCIAKVPEGGWYRLAVGKDRKLRYISIYLGGEALAVGACARLEAGEYPVALRLWPEPVGGWEPMAFSLSLVKATEGEAQAWLAAETAAREVDAKVAAARRAAAAAWGLNPEAMRWLRLAAASAEGYFRRGLGDCGWNQEGEAYTRHAVRAAMPFALCYRNAMGRDIGGAERLGMILALATAATVFSDDGAAMQSYNVGGGPMDADLFARGFPFVPEALRPAVLWSWNRTLALAEAGKLKDPHGVIAGHDGLSAALMLIAWPAGRAEKRPGDVMDRVTADRQKGGYIFRNRWQDGQDCVVSLFANDNQAGGSWASAQGGTFRINALGEAWAVRGQGYGNGGSGRALPDFSLYQNMVDVAEHYLAGSPQARTVFFEPAKDGSGAVSLNMDEIYIHSEKEKVTSGTRETWNYLGRKDLGIRALRSLAVDYSGLSGAPCLVAVADRIAGTQGRNTWQMSTEREHAVACEGSTFTITASSGATLRGTVVAPAGAAVRAVEAEHVHEINYHGRHSRTKFLRRVVLVDGSDMDQNFLVVMTIQKGPAPAVQASGKDGAKVGARHVRFDGRKIALGQ